MASIVLEPVNPQEPEDVEKTVEEPAAPVEQAEEETDQASPEPLEEEVLAPLEATPEPSASEVSAPAPKKRGLPPKAKAEAKAPGLPKAKPAPKSKPKARKPPPPESDSDRSTDVEDTLRNFYRHNQPDMETAILQFLGNRRQSEQTRRRELWSQLAKF